MKDNTPIRETLIIIIIVTTIILPFIIHTQIKNKYNNQLKIVVYKSRDKQKAILRGKILFKDEDCYSCHKPDKRQHINLTKNLLKRRDKDYLIRFIKNEDSLLKAKHPIVIALKEQYNWANGKHNSKLSKEKIMDILYFLES